MTAQSFHYPEPIMPSDSEVELARNSGRVLAGLNLKKTKTIDIFQIVSLGLTSLMAFYGMKMKYKKYWLTGEFAEWLTDESARSRVQIAKRIENIREEGHITIR
jgi:hypothetical protein